MPLITMPFSHFFRKEKQMKELETKNIQNEKQIIINEIVQILEKNNLSISEANDILYATTKKLYQQPVKYCK